MIRSRYTAMDSANRPIGAFEGALAVLEEADDAFVACDSAFRIVFLNAAAKRLCGRPKAQLLGALPWQPSSRLGGSELEIESRRVMAERVPGKIEYYNRRSTRCLEVRTAPASWGGITL